MSNQSMEAHNALKERILGLSNEIPGCTYWKTALHVHTEHRDGQHSIDPEEMVKRFLDHDYRLIAITNHNSIKGINETQIASQNAYIETGTKLVILPGVEITTRGGAHVLAIFPENKDLDQIKNMLIKMGIQKPEEINLDVTTDDEYRGSSAKIFELIRKFDGIPILPHVTLENVGLWDRMSGVTRQDFFTSGAFWIIEQERNKRYPNEGEKLKPLPEQFEQDSRFKDRFTVLNPADIYDLGSIEEESRATWIKMDKPSFDGIKQIEFGNRARVSQAPPKEIEHPIIRAVFSNGKYIEKENFLLNPHLNVVIGERGTGKTILIDLIRFIFNISVTPDYPLGKRLHDIIGDGNWAALIQEFADHSSYLYIRTLETQFNRQIHSVTGKEWYDVTSPPSSIFKIDESNGETELVPVTEELQLLDDTRPELYGQGEVQQIQNNYTTLLEIIDSSCPSGKTKRKLATITKELDGHVEEILESLNEFDTLKQLIESYDTKVHRLQEIQPFIDDEHLKQHSKWLQDEDTISKLEKELVKRENLISQLISRLSFQTPHLVITDDFVQFLELTDQYVNHVTSTSVFLYNEFSHLMSIFNQNLKRWKNALERHAEIYSELLITTNTESRDALVREAEDLKRELVRLNARIIELNERIKVKLSEKLTLFNIGCQDYERVRNQLTKERKEYAKELSRRHSDLRLGIRKAGDKTAFNDLIKPVLKGLTKQDRLIYLMLNTFAPSEMANLLRNSDRDVLRMKLKEFQDNEADQDQVISITDKFLDKMISFPDIKRIFDMDIPTNPTFYRLYYCDLVDRPVVSLKIGSDADYQEIANLSIGEACSALLSLALMHKENPLVIDQPEDDLDPFYVWEIIVSELIQRKTRRQFIFVTHTANIPVIGDAEQIIKMSLIQKGKCVIEREGGFETMFHVLMNLEGGPKAYKKRMERYSCSGEQFSA